MSKTDWPEEIYENISINDLILVSLYQSMNVSKSPEGLDFEGLLQGCFILFPAKFKFSRLNFADARKLDRPLRRLKTEKLIKGGKEELFYLTRAGQKRAVEITNFLRQTKLKLK